MRKKINKLNFTSVYSVSMGEIALKPVSTYGIYLGINYFAHLVEIGVQKYPPSFSYWTRESHFN